MSASSPESKSPPPPLAPPSEEFWERYSPHHEFPLSSVGSIALHVGGLVLILLALWLLSRLAISDKTPVPMRVMRLADDGDGAEGRGGGGGTNRKENVDPVKQNIPRDVPQAKIDQVVPELKRFLPQVPSNQPGLRPEDLPNVPKFAGLDPDLQNKLLEGASGKKGKGEGEGSGGAGPEGAGGGNAHDPSSSASRAIRWELDFKTQSGEDYLQQLRAMKATLLIPQPPDWKEHKSYRLADSDLRGEPFDVAKLPGLHFIDDDSGSASRLARAMGLNFSPPKFLAFFPKDIEEELATREREYRGRRENEIFSTTFKVLVRDGRPAIVVTDQVPVRK
jgi:hypothetical protein